MLDKPKDALFEPRAERAALPPPGPRTIEPDQGLTLALLLRVIRRRKWPLLLCLVAFPLAALVALKQVTPRYTATTTVIFEAQQFSITELQSILREDTTTDTVVNSQVQIIDSLAMAGRVAERLNLAASDEFNPFLRPASAARQLVEGARSWAAARVTPLSPGLAEAIAPDTPEEPTAEQLRNIIASTVQERMRVDVVPRSRVLAVSFTSQDAEIAAKAANLLAEFYIGDQLEAKFTAVRRANSWLEERIAGLRREVLDAEEKIQAFRTQHGLVQGQFSGLSAERVSRLQADLLAQRSELALAEARKAQAQARNYDGLPQVQNNPAILNLRTQEAQLRRDLATQSAQLGNRHPDVIRARNALADNQRLLEAEIARVVAAVHADAAAARTRVETTTQALAEAQRQANQAGTDEIQVRILEREAEAARTLLTAILQRSQQTVAQTAIEKPDARVLSPAVPPTRPSWPRSMLMLLGSLGLGGMFGLLVIYFLEMADRSLHGGEEVRAELGLACLALVPEMKRRLGRGGRIEDYVVAKPLSAAAEAMRSVRAGLWLGAEPPKCVVVTAARPGEGKTTTAIGLARVAAAGGERVILIDCDLRQPGFSRVFGRDDGPGLVDLLQGNASLASVRKRDRLTELDYITVGSSEPNASRLFMVETMGELIEKLRHDYDLIVLDSPPVLAMVDARVIGRIADATLLCVRWRDTPRSVVRAAMEVLVEAKANVVGALLTRVDPKSHRRSGYADAEVYHPRYGGYFRN
ncbi:MAG: polysaccharide biosynthesis tyrosine autokinase [Acetobacteraceae bacterium]|nr:polysaccharide biosynthesis tyrosine autokinase [Acetobacteraceae bacterium]